MSSTRAMEKRQCTTDAPSLYKSSRSLRARAKPTVRCRSSALGTSALSLAEIPLTAQRLWAVARALRSMIACSGNAECAGTADVPSATGAFSAICDLFTHLCIDFDSAQMLGQACQIEPLAAAYPLLSFPGAQDEVCGSCFIKSCTYADALRCTAA